MKSCIYEGTIILLRERAARMRTYVRSAAPAIYPAMLFGPNRLRRMEAKRFLKAIAAETGRLAWKERLLGWTTVPFALWAGLSNRLHPHQQPRQLRIEHRT